ncbi:hypothetical protein LCGC14_0568000 [marine sediment metagenome]|uniref:Uncharacterized protein n=1 Tax=marine sediment metagenome TaxID=412755 RepID=A0A0F9RK04_9ZZZZ
MAAEICVTENLQREDLSVIEEGHAVALLLERAGWTFETVGAQVGRHPKWVARRASLWTQQALEDNPEPPAWTKKLKAKKATTKKAATPAAGTKGGKQ